MPQKWSKSGSLRQNPHFTISTVGYNNKILVSDGNFILGKNEKVNAGLAKSEEETTTKQKTLLFGLFLISYSSLFCIQNLI